MVDVTKGIPVSEQGVSLPSPPVFLLPTPDGLYATGSFVRVKKAGPLAHGESVDKREGVYRLRDAWESVPAPNGR